MKRFNMCWGVINQYIRDRNLDTPVSLFFLHHNFLILQCLVNIFMDIIPKGFGMPHTNSGVLLFLFA